MAALEAARSDPDGLVRVAAARGFDLLPPEERLAALTPLFSDPLRAVRAEAAGSLAGLDLAALGALGPEARAALDEYESIQRSLLERPEARLNLAQLHLARGDRRGRAERAALRLDPPSCRPSDPADVVRDEGRERGRGRAARRTGTRADAAVLHHALGLRWCARSARRRARAARGRLGPRIRASATSTRSRPRPRPGEGGARDARARRAPPGDRDARLALASYRAESGDAGGAQRSRSCRDQRSIPARRRERSGT